MALASQRRTESIHATGLVIGEAGLLVRGKAGAGKSTLAQRLVVAACAAGRFAALVGDDRVRLERHDHALIARVHPAIAGLVEQRGIGIVETRFEAACRVRAVIDLVDGGVARLPEHPRQASLLGVMLPRLALERDAAEPAAILAWLDRETRSIEIEPNPKILGEASGAAA